MGRQLHRALDIRKQYRDLLALTFEYGLRLQDLVGEMFGGVVGDTADLRHGRRSGHGARTTLVAKLGRGAQFAAAPGADSAEGCSAFLAEFGVRSILVLAAWTSHDVFSDRSRRFPIFF